MKKLTSINKISHNALKGGYSLIEILVYLGLLGIFIYSLTNLFVSSLDLKIESEARSSVEQDGRYIMSRMRYDLLTLSDVSVPANPGDTANSLSATVSSSPFSYSLDNGNLMISFFGVSEQLNSSRTRVTNMTFTRRGEAGGKNTITVNYTLESTAERPTGPEVRDYEVTYALR